jgi:hypothetical protein
MRGLITIFSLLLLAGPVAVSAQALRGELVDPTGVPIEEATATLLDSSGVEVRSSRSDADGVFHLVAARGGQYRVALTRIGFNPYTTDPVVLRPGETVVIEIRMSARPQALSTMTIKERTRREWGRDGWAQRKALGAGVFLTGDEIRARDARTVAEALRIVEGLEIRYRPLPEITTTRGSRCLQYVINNLPLPVIPAEHPSVTLTRMMETDRVMGVEVYREFKEVPRELRTLAVQNILPDDRVAAPTPRRRSSASPDVPPSRNCGLINIWTHKAW